MGFLEIIDLSYPLGQLLAGGILFAVAVAMFGVAEWCRIRESKGK